MRSHGRSRIGVASALLAASGLLVVSGCTSAADTTTAVVDTANATVIDVRTPEEFASGHLQDATNIDVQSADFTTQIAGLPKDATYVVYCRSGNRSAAAVAQMEAQGFTSVVDAGSVSEASRSTGIPVVN